MYKNVKIEISELTNQDKRERRLPKVTFTFGEFKNLKIAINDQQPLDEVVSELDRIGCWFNMGDGNNNLAEWVLVMGDRYDIYNNDRCVDGDWCKETTLAELKSMNID